MVRGCGFGEAQHLDEPDEGGEMRTNTTFNTRYTVEGRVHGGAQHLDQSEEGGEIRIDTS